MEWLSITYKICVSQTTTMIAQEMVRRKRATCFDLGSVVLKHLPLRVFFELS